MSDFFKYFSAYGVGDAVKKRVKLSWACLQVNPLGKVSDNTHISSSALQSWSLPLVLNLSSKSYISIVLVVFGAILLTGCATDQRFQTEKIYWPKPPDQPRYIYETTLRSGKSIQISSSGDSFKSMMTGLYKKKQDAFAKPYDVAAYGGKIVVTDSVSRVALLFDIPRQQMYPFGNREDGRLLKPMGVAMDGQQFIYVADISDKRVKVYDPLGRFLRAIGAKGEFDRPIDVAVNKTGERIYVVDAGGIDSGNHKISIFDRAGKRLSVIGRRGIREGEFNLPAQAVVAPDGTLYVLDAGNFRVQAFDPDGKFLSSWGKVGRSFGDFARPRGIAVDSEGNIYVTDAAFRNFQIFNPDGKLLMAVGGVELDDKPGQFVLPAGIAIDETDRVYIVDQMMRKVDVLRKLTEVERQKLSGKVQ